MVVEHLSCFPASLAAINVAGGSVALTAGLASAFSTVKQSAVLLLWWLGMQATLTVASEVTPLPL